MVDARHPGKRHQKPARGLRRDGLQNEAEQSDRDCGKNHVDRPPTVPTARAATDARRFHGIPHETAAHPYHQITALGSLWIGKAHMTPMRQAHLPRRSTAVRLVGLTPSTVMAGLVPRLSGWSTDPSQPSWPGGEACPCEGGGPGHPRRAAPRCWKPGTLPILSPFFWWPSPAFTRAPAHAWLHSREPTTWMARISPAMTEGVGPSSISCPEWQMTRECRAS